MTDGNNNSNIRWMKVQELKVILKRKGKPNTQKRKEELVFFGGKIDWKECMMTCKRTISLLDRKSFLRQISGMHCSKRECDKH